MTDMTLDQKKETASNWFRNLRDQMCAAFEAIEDQVAGAPKSVKRIGDADAPAIIAAAVYAGHKYARELDCDIDPDNPAKHDRVFFEE